MVRTIVAFAPETVTCELVTAIVCTTELSLDFLMTTFPEVPFWIFSLKVITRFVVTDTPVALSAGDRLFIVGFCVSMLNTLGCEKET